MKIVVVGFKTTEDNSVYYKKFEVTNPIEDRDRIGAVMGQALNLSDFVSVRKIDKEV